MPDEPCHVDAGEESVRFWECKACGQWYGIPCDQVPRGEQSDI